MVGNVNAFEEILDTAGRILDTKDGLDPVADLVGVAKAASADLRFELIDLVRSKVARVTLIVDLTESVGPFVAKDTEPFAELGKADPQQLSNFGSSGNRAFRFGFQP